MGYLTEAGEARDRAKEHIKEAIKELTTIVTSSVSGADDFNMGYRQRLRRVLTQLISLDQF